MDNTIVRFSLAEAVFQIIIADFLDAANNVLSIIDSDKTKLQFLLSIINQSLSSINPNNLSIPFQLSKRSTSVIVLVLVKNCHGNLNIMNDNDLKSCLWSLIMLLKENDGFIQDMSCLGICHIYKLSSFISTSIPSNKKLSDWVVNEVINALTREKRVHQPAGYSVAGESSNLTSPNVENDSNTPNNNGGVPAAIPINRNDPLALATASAAMELGIQTDNLSNNIFNDPSDNDFGVYRIVCKVAKKVYNLLSYFLFMFDNYRQVILQFSLLFYL